MHRKIIFEKVGSSVIEISEIVHCSRRFYAISFISVWNEISLGSQGTVNQTTSCQHTLSVFNRGNKIWVLVLVRAHSWLNSYTPKLAPMFYYRDKTRVQKLYFLNKTRFTLKKSFCLENVKTIEQMHASQSSNCPDV